MSAEVTDLGGRERAWTRVRDALPGRWRLSPVEFDADERVWTITAGRPDGRASVVGEGQNELAALQDLDDRLRGLVPSVSPRREALNRRLRRAFLNGAEGWSKATLGRGLSAEELGRALNRYPGDVTL